MISVIVVTLALITNIIALALSFPSVFEDSPIVYRSGINGNIDLPYLPGSIDDYWIEIPNITKEGEPIPISIGTSDGSTPSLPLSIKIVGDDGSYQRHQLFDAFRDNNWYSWTVFPGDLSPGEYSLDIEYRGIHEYLPIGKTGSDLIVSERNGTFPFPIVNGSLWLDEGISIHIGGSDQREVSEVQLILKNGTEFDMEHRGNGNFYLGMEGKPLRGWHYVTFRLSWNDSDYNDYGEYLFHFGSGEAPSSMFDQLKITHPFSGFDELYEQKPIDVLVTEGGDDPEILTSTYYQFILDLSLNKTVNGDLVPLPTPIMSIEGKRVYLRPMIPLGRFGGMLRSPDSYNDHQDDGLMIRSDDWDKNLTILEKDLFLRERQSPEIIFEPDPFDEPEKVTGDIELRIEEGWELVTYRDFNGTPLLSLDLERLSMERKISSRDSGDIIAYSSILPLSGDLLGQEVKTEAYAEFQMEVTVSFIFFSFPIPLTGSMIPAWFTFISLSITFSLFILAFRSIKKGKKIGWGAEGRTDLIRSGPDLYILSTTYMAALFFSWVVVIMFDLLEQPTPVPSLLSDQTPIWIRMVLLADASVWEEVVARVMFIGIPLLLFHPSRKWGIERFKVLLGGKGSFGKPEVILILVSSSFFGLAHLGWGPWKVIPTFVTGALFGYLYIKVGLHAAIAMHFLFDYDSFIYELLDYPYLQLYIVYYLAILMGGFFLAWILVRSKHWLRDRSGRDLDRKWILISHSLLTITLVIFIVLTSSFNGYAMVLTSVPLLNAGAIMLDRSRVKYVPAIMVVISSFISLALAPIGLMWLFDKNEKDHGSDQNQKVMLS